MTEEKGSNSSETVASLARDPVCGMNVNPADAKHTHLHSGKTYYFCCSHCAQKFKSNPQEYLKGVVSSGLVTLGMHSTPQVSQIQHSTNDPVCGMTVNPATAKFAADHEGTKFYFCGRSCLEK